MSEFRPSWLPEGKSFEECSQLSDTLRRDGIGFSDLREGEVHKYTSSNHDYTFHIVGSGIPVSGYVVDAGVHPIVRLDVHFFGELQESTAGYLLGTSPWGNGMGLHQCLPPAGHNFVACIIETLPPSEPMEDLLFIPGYGTYDTSQRPEVILIRESPREPQGN